MKPPTFGDWYGVHDPCECQPEAWPLLTARIGSRWQIFLLAKGVVVRIARQSYASEGLASRPLVAAIMRRGDGRSDLDDLVRIALRVRRTAAREANDNGKPAARRRTKPRRRR